MRFSKYEFNLSKGEGVEVTLSRQANVKLMTPANFDSYRRRLSHHFFGGVQQVSTAIIVPNVEGYYILTVDLIGFAGNVSHGARIVQC